MTKTVEQLTFRSVESYLKRGSRAWKQAWPDAMWVEMCIDNQYKFVIHRDGTYEPWHPTLHDYAESVWCVSTN